MPEPITILSITLGILGFLSTARNSIQTIHDDVKTWKKAKLTIEDLCASLDEHSQSLADWKEDWMIWEHDDPFCEFLWGENRTMIQDKLGQISKRSEELSISLQKLSRKSNKTWIKIKFLFMKRKYLEECMTKLGQIVTRLHETARGHYRTKHGCRDTPKTEEIQLSGNLFQNVRLCLKTRNLSQELHDACKRDPCAWVVDLELDFFTKDVADDRPKAISKSAATSNLRYAILAKQNQESETVIRVVVYRDTTLERRDCQRTLAGALQKVFDQQARPSAFNNPDGDGPCYRVEESPRGSNLQSLCYRRYNLSQAGNNVATKPEVSVLAAFFSSINSPSKLYYTSREPQLVDLHEACSLGQTRPTITCGLFLKY